MAVSSQSAWSSDSGPPHPLARLPRTRHKRLRRPRRLKHVPAEIPPVQHMVNRPRVFILGFRVIPTTSNGHLGAIYHKDYGLTPSAWSSYHAKVAARSASVRGAMTKA